VSEWTDDGKQRTDVPLFYNAAFGAAHPEMPIIAGRYGCGMCKNGMRPGRDLIGIKYISL
jgi:hypothetical protein